MENKTSKSDNNDDEKQHSSFFKYSCPSVCLGMSSKENHCEAVVEEPRPGLISGGKGGFTCCVPGCFNNNKRDKHLSFYNFPNGKSKEKQILREKWINAVSRKNFKPTIGHRVCSEHFVGGQKTYVNNIPTITPKTRLRRLVIPRTTTKARNRAFVIKERSRSTHNLEYKEALDEASEGICDTLPESSTVTGELRNLTLENSRLKEENEKLKAENLLLRNKLKEESAANRFSIEYFKLGNNRLFRFYTGLEDYDTFKAIFDSFGAGVRNLIYHDSGTKASNMTSPDYLKCGPKRFLSPEMEFFLMLVRLRLGLLEEDIAHRVGLSVSHISRIFITWFDFLHARFRQYPIWPSRLLIDEKMPRSFKETYPTTRVVIDCTELYIERASSLRSQSVTYSTYKHHNTAKGLIGISPAGSVSFVLDLYAGRSSDKQVTLASSLLTLLEKGDSIMADKGFDIQNVLPEGVSLNIPPFLRAKEFLSMDEEVETQKNCISADSC